VGLISSGMHQIYVNGEYAGVTVDAGERKMVVHMPASEERAAKIEVFAVEPEQSSLDFSDELSAINGYSGRVKISWPRLGNLPVGASAEVYSDGGSGSIDYDVPITIRPERIWAAWQDKGGFGLSRFGRSDFGFDGSAAVGFGRGAYGIGEFGFDADVMCYSSCELASGRYRFAVRISDSFGNNDESYDEIGPITVIAGPKPVRETSVLSFVKQSNELVLGVS